MTAHDQKPHFDFTRRQFLVQGPCKIAPLEPVAVRVDDGEWPDG